MQLHREAIKAKLQSQFNSRLEDSVDRALEIRHQNIIPNHHFSMVASECVRLYQDGNLTALVMATQALNEGLIRFIEERNGIADQKERKESVENLVKQGIISQKAGDASKRILKSFRNDFHHMNPSVSKVPIKDIAKRNLEDICIIEKELFDCSIVDRKLRLKQCKYWDISKEGVIEVLLR